MNWSRAPCMLFCLIIVPPSSQNVCGVLKIDTSSIRTLFVHFMCQFCVLCWSSTAHNVISLISLTPPFHFPPFPLSVSLFHISNTNHHILFIFFIGGRWTAGLWSFSGIVFFECAVCPSALSMCVVLPGAYAALLHSNTTSLDMHQSHNIT